MAGLIRYGSAVRSLNRVLAAGSAGCVTLTNYEDPLLSPVRSTDLLRAAAEPERNPFYPYFSQRLSSLIAEQNPGYVGFSLNYLTQALCTFAMIGFLRKHYEGRKNHAGRRTGHVLAEPSRLAESLHRLGG